MDQEFENPKIIGYTVYSKSGCPNCTKVKKYLTEVNAPVNIVDCDEYLIETKDEFLKFIEENAGKSVRMFPIVFFERKFVGGYYETENHYNMLNAFSNNLFF
jgi:glutaredoxin